jgi:hypothetical protein
MANTIKRTTSPHASPARATALALHLRQELQNAASWRMLQTHRELAHRRVIAAIDALVDTHLAAITAP